MVEAFIYSGLERAFMDLVTPEMPDAAAVVGMLHVVDHVLVDHYLAQLRDQNTDSIGFRGAVRRLAMLLAYEATKDLPARPRPIETPLTTTTGRCLCQRIALVPILRAGLGMVEPVHDLLPDAEVRHLGFYRDEQTLTPVGYYQNLPADHAADIALVLDPMLATGGSAIAALEAVRQWGVPRLKLLALIAVPEGIARVQEAFPEAQIYVCAVDSHLNESGYIVPGLGDAGDRIFRTAAR